jgi:hypothetical protein
MPSPDFGARPHSTFEMANQEHLILDRLVQVKSCVIYALLALVFTS